MEIEEKIIRFEKRHKILVRDYQAGKIDEARYIAEVDKLQFQDGWGRYWMIGAQSGSWHYYDGQNWQQADPREADRLPFMDDQGIYWQRGVKSGDWYYYQPDTGEWVKPGAGDAVASPSVGRGQTRPQPTSTFVPAQTQLHPQSQDAGPGMPGQLDGQLFQDDEGRYWAIGEKTGQWYFYDQNGWHPAHEFRTAATPAPAQTPYTQPYQPQMGPATPTYAAPPYQPAGYPQPAASSSNPPYQSGGYSQPAAPPSNQNYVVQPQQPTSPTQPIQIYITSPGSETQPTGGQYVQQSISQPQQPAAAPYQPAQPYATPQPAQSEILAQAPAEAPTVTPEKPAPAEPGQPPMPPKEPTDSGSWYYFDGQQWLKYATGEPDQSPQSLPKMVIEQQPKSAKVKAEPKSEPVMAEFIEDEPPVEVVDVEVITVIDPEPEAKSQPKQTAPAPQPAAEPKSNPRPAVEEPRPRRASRPVEVPRRQEEQLQAQPVARGSRPVTEPNRTVPPRKREAAHEPTIIIPTGAAASNISSPRSPSARTASRPVRPAPAQERRARENTLPMEPVRRVEPTPAPEVHRTVTQAMPTPAAVAARANTAPVLPVAPPAKQTTQQKADPVTTSATTAKSAAAQPQIEKESYTVGDVLRSLPSTLWTFVGGVVILLACAVGLIFTWSWFQGDDLGSGGLVVVPSLTPTLDAGPPDATPTVGPTATPELEAGGPATPVALTTFTSTDLGYRVEYPENWEQVEEELCGMFSPSSAGLDKDKPEDAAMIICKSAEEGTAIADLLTEVLAAFPADAETLNEGTISIASQIWTSAQIRYEAEDLGGQGIATLAVTNNDGDGYYLMALAPAEAWNSVQPQFQAMINSFSFSTDAVAQAAASVTAETTAADEEDETTNSKGTPTPAKTSEAKSTPKATPTPKGTATPLVYRIQSGDTLLAIATKFGVDVELLTTKNNITDPTSLQLGQELVIPFTAEELEAFNAGSTETTTTAAAAAPTGPITTTAETGAETAETGTADTPVAAPPAAEAAAPSGNAAAATGRIVYPAFNPNTNVYDIWMADIATGEQTIIATEASQPAFNRDGSLLAYRSWNLGNRGIFFRDFIGGREGQVTRFVEDGLPTWSPDGYSFAFATRREGDRVPRIFVGNQSGDGDYGIGFQGEYPATFPDGRLVARGCSPAGDCGLYVMGASGGGEKKVSSEFSDTAPAVSPDGSKIAVMSSARGATNWEIWVMNADGSNPQRLTSNGSNEGLPTWSPDGKSIAYVSDQGGSWAVWVMNADGSNQRKLFNMNGTPDGKVLRDIDNSKGWLEERISWAP